MKRLMISIVLILITLPLISAQIAVHSPEDTIFRISSNTNAHGENYTGSYSVPIYYSDIFTGVYSGVVSPANIHMCSGTNRVLRLSSNTNAHAQEPYFSGTAYPVDICYGDLVCTSVAGNANCATGYNEIVSLSSNDNAHIEDRNANSYNGATNVKVCCQMTALPTISNLRWRYYDGSIIPPNANVCPNSYLVSSVQTANIADGQTVYFDFYDQDSGPDDHVAGPFAVSVVNNQANLTFNLTDPVIRGYLQTLLDDPTNDVELYFNAYAAIAPTNILSSYNILYTENESMCHFSKPISNITAPKHRGVYFANTEINFTSGCSSQMGPIQNQWTITQGSNTITNTSSSFKYTFSSTGQANVKLRCNDLSGNFDISESQILIVGASPDSLAYIEEPQFLGFVENTFISNPYFPTNVPFRAGESFALNVVTACSSIVCLGGDCPARTENSLLSCGTGGAPVTITPTSGGVTYSTLRFNWTFWDNDWNDEWSSYEGVGIYSGAIPYDDVSNVVNDKHMSVFITELSSGVNASFQRDFTLGRCLNNGNTYYRTSNETYATTLENDACKGGDLIAGSADDCCPSGLVCMQGTTLRYSCQIPSGSIPTSCEDLLTQESCNNNNNTALAIASYGGNPPACTTLRCTWDNLAQRCGVNITRYQQNSSGCNYGPGNPPPVSSCGYSTSTTECLNGRKTISYNLIQGGVGSCLARDPVTVPCGSLSFELDFFGKREFLISIILIIFGYFVISLYRKNNGKE